MTLAAVVDVCTWTSPDDVRAALARLVRDHVLDCIKKNDVGYYNLRDPGGAATEGSDHNVADEPCGHPSGRTC